ncbi:TetR family transcriptional regulator [Xenorhabdus hominickii]|uniref:Transcriptional regulator n=1 Tax=Xenorhabdus hominickii TaxID=351679 RepID=A0A2G0QDR7_XENHO|nr:TetR family transcriptional regulator [Xenorhabdus hominickii]AOM41433.1 transcriptional regulator [Xenorhabdus hominickii]PHM57351.1 transcriptional regulator [Xenorhabdus hominickii]
MIDRNKEEFGRRERKKRMLRNALIKASYELFSIKGFDETRIEDITEKVDVSTRTFFRYFASKEEVVLDYQEAENKDFITALSHRPSSESVITALRHAAVEVVKKCEKGSYGFDADRFMTLQELLRNHPLVRAKSFQYSENTKNSITSLIAKRMGTNISDDIRPSIITGILDYAHWAAYNTWKKNTHNTVVPYSDILNKVFLIIEGGLNFPASNSSNSGSTK